jgi:hypothetical protein
MTLRMLLVASLLPLAACSQAQETKGKTEPVKADATGNTAEAVKTEKKSLEEAADAAAKLIEADAQEEIESLSDDSSQ